MAKKWLASATTALIVAFGAVSVFAQSGAVDYVGNCAECHGPDGRGTVAAMRAVPGYRPLDLTQLSKKNGGVFPRQEVTDAIDGRRRFAAHFRGDMPRWGSQFHIGDGDDAAVKRRISALVDYIESLQETSDAIKNQ
jgi:mono/diheme cytochrome c family protein